MGTWGEEVALEEEAEGTGRGRGGGEAGGGGRTRRWWREAEKRAVWPDQEVVARRKGEGVAQGGRSKVAPWPEGRRSWPR